MGRSNTYQEAFYLRYSDSTIFLTGQAKPGREDAVSSVYQIFSLSLFVDTETDRIVNLACTTAMEETEEFIRFLLVGKNLARETEEMSALLQRRFFGMLQKPLIAALKDAENRYFMLFPEKRAEKAK